MSDPTQSAPMNDAAGSVVLLRDFVIERDLGAGGVGRVRLVRSRSTGRLFAVKTMHTRDRTGREQALAELRGWLDVPSHPNVLPLRFLRTESRTDELALFSDVADAGSLADRLRGRGMSILDVLDAAIQLAWGIHAAHEAGVLHQDVKPSNALLTKAGVVKVADFGLSRAVRSAANAGVGPTGQGDGWVTGHGGSRAYGSPEQIRGGTTEPLGRSTDVYSFGVTVLELLLGGRRWDVATAAPRTLQRVLDGREPGRASIPGGAESLLDQCFREDPAGRWPTLLAAADRLVALFEAVAGRPYQRPQPEFTTRPAPEPHDRCTASDTVWRPPDHWLARAAAVGLPPQEPPADLGRGATRRGRAVDDLIAYGRAEAALTAAASAGRTEAEAELAALCSETAFIHEALDDLTGAVAWHSRAVSQYARLVESGGKLAGEWLSELAGAHLNLAGGLFALGEIRPAVRGVRIAIRYWTALRGEPGWEGADGDLAIAHLNLGVLYHSVGRPDRARRHVRSALRLTRGSRPAAPGLPGRLGRAFTAMAEVELKAGRPAAAARWAGRAVRSWRQAAPGQGSPRHLAGAVMTRALARMALGENARAVPDLDAAIVIWESLVLEVARGDLKPDLARAHLNRAVAAWRAGRDGARGLFDRAVDHFRKLVQREGRGDLADDLAAAHQNRAVYRGASGDLTGAVRDYRAAARILRQLVAEESRREHLPALASAFHSRAVPLTEMGDAAGAVRWCDRAILIWEKLIARGGCYADRQAQAYFLRGNALQAAGDFPAAAASYGRAVEIRTHLIEVEGRVELRGDLAWAEAYEARCLGKLGDRGAALGQAVRAALTLKAEADRTGRADLSAAVTWVADVIGELVRPLAAGEDDLPMPRNAPLGTAKAPGGQPGTSGPA